MNREQASLMLIVEDSDEDYELIQWAFKKSGIIKSTIRCVDGEDALDYLYRRGEYEKKIVQRPAFIWLDLNLPGTDGREVLAQIKRDENLKMIPVVVVTTSSNNTDVELCYQHGANSYIIKPMNLDRLVEKVKQLNDFWFEAVALPSREERST